MSTAFTNNNNNINSQIETIRKQANDLMELTNSTIVVDGKEVINIRKDTSFIHDELYYKLVVIICIFNNITITNDTIRIEAKENVKIGNSEKMLLKGGKKKKGGNDENTLVRRDAMVSKRNIPRGSLRSILQLFSMIVTLYLTTQILIYTMFDNMETQKQIAQTKTTALEAALLRPLLDTANPEVYTLNKLMDLYSQNKETVEFNFEEYNYDKETFALTTMVSNIQNMKVLALPMPPVDDVNISSDFNPLSVNTLVKTLSGASVFSSSIDRLRNIESIADAKMEDAKKIKDASEKLYTEAKDAYNELMKTSDKPFETTQEVLYNLMSFLTMSTRESMVGNMYRKFYTGIEIAKILPDVIQSQMALIPNVPRYVSEITQHYSNIYYSLCAFYAWSGILNGIFGAFFYYLINKLLPDKDIKEEDLQKIKDGFLSIDKYKIIFELQNASAKKKLSINMAKSIFKQNMITETARNLQNYDQQVDKFLTLVFETQEMKDAINSLSSMSKSYDASENWLNLLEVAEEEMEKISMGKSTALVPYSKGGKTRRKRAMRKGKKKTARKMKKHKKTTKTRRKKRKLRKTRKSKKH